MSTNATAVCKCGHLKSEHRADVLPFVACHHSDDKEFRLPGVMAFAYLVAPCWCSNFEVRG